jgi:hypothetical protein
MQTLLDHYTHKPKNYETISYQDIKSGKLPSHVDCISIHGDVIHTKVTSIKTWKKRPEIEIHLKYGLYKYAETTIYPDNSYRDLILVKEVY